MDGMLKHAKSLDAKYESDVRLTVFDVNTIAKSWYHKLGFRVVNLQCEFLGRKELRRTVVFEELRWIHPPLTKLPPFCQLKRRFTISPICTSTAGEEIQELFHLQDAFAEEHLELSRLLYGDDGKAEPFREAVKELIDRVKAQIP